MLWNPTSFFIQPFFNGKLQRDVIHTKIILDYPITLHCHCVYNSFT